MANAHSKNNLAEQCEISGTNGECVNDKHNNAGSFSDLCSTNNNVAQDTNTKIDMIGKCTNMKQSNCTVKFCTDTSQGYKKHSLNIPNISHHNQTIKIFHQNIRSLRNKTNELLCCIQDDPPHILCLTEHHLQYGELASSHIENYSLGAYYCRNTKHKGGVCIFIQKSIPFTCLDIGNYCIDQDIEVCGIQLNHACDKLCILAVYRSPSGNFSNFLIKLDSVLQKLFLLKFTFIICGDININYFADSYKKKQLDSILYSFNLCSIVNFPTRVGPNSSSLIDNVFLDNSYINKYDIAPVINGLSDHDAQLLAIQILQKHNNTRHMYYKRNINKFTIAEFLLKLSYETWDSIFAENDVNKIYNSFLNTILRHYHSCFPLTKTNKPHDKSWITTGTRTSCKHKSELYSERRNHKNLALDRYYKDYCRILSKAIKEAKKMEYDRRILNSTNKMKTSWNLINIE